MIHPAVMMMLRAPRCVCVRIYVSAREADTHTASHPRNLVWLSGNRGHGWGYRARSVARRPLNDGRVLECTVSLVPPRGVLRALLCAHAVSSKCIIRYVYIYVHVLMSCRLVLCGGEDFSIPVRVCTCMCKQWCWSGRRVRIKS